MASTSISALNERLRSVASRGNCEEIEQLIRLGASFEVDKYGRTALHYAAHYGQVKAIKLIIARGCELDTEDTYGCTPLHKAVAPDGYVEAVRALLEEGCAVERQEENGNTALHEAAWNGFSQTLDLLIRIGKANTHASNKNGQKPIHMACQNGHNQSTRLLLKAGTHPNIKDNSSETPLHIACLFGHMTCARILLSAECDANAKNKDGNTPLHIAASLGKQKITRLLIEAQCEVKIRNKNNQTALELARRNDHADVVLLILGAHRMKKGKLPFFSRKKKKEGDRQDLGETFHSTHHHRDSSHHKQDDKDKHKHRDNKKRDDDDMDGGQGGLRVRGRREIGGVERQSSGSSKGKSKKKRDKKREDSQLKVEQTRAQNLFVKDELKKKVKSEKQLQEQIHVGREMGNPLFTTQPFRDKMGKIIHVPMPVHCNCTPYIKKLENQVEASKERLLHEIDMSKARFESRMNNMEKRMTHQAQCMDQLCKERIAAERTDCVHRIDRRAMEERERSAAEQTARGNVLRKELKDWFESRIQPLHEQLSRTCLDDTAIAGAAASSSSARRGRPRAGFYKLHGREAAMNRKRSKSESNISDCDRDDDDDEEDEEEDDSEEETDEEEEQEVDHRTRIFVEQQQRTSRQPSEQSPHRHKRGSPVKEKEYAKNGAIPKKSRSGSFRQAVSDEDGHSSSNSGTQLSLVDGVYRPPLIASHERSPPVDSHHTLPPEYGVPSEETDDTESSGSESDTASQLSLETVSHKAKSISGSTNVSSSTRDSGHHTLKGSSVSSDRRSHAPTRANLIAYQALTVNARPPPPLPAPERSHASPNAHAQPLSLSMQRPYTPQFSPPISPTSTASQPMSTSTLASRDGRSDGVVTPITEPTSSENPSPTDSGKTPSTSSGVSSGDAPSLSNPSPIKYNVISPHTGQSHPHTYNPRTSSNYQADLIKDIAVRNRTSGSREPPPQYSRVNHSNGAPRNFADGHLVRGNSNNANNNAAANGGRDGTDSVRSGSTNPSSNYYNRPNPRGNAFNPGRAPGYQSQGSNVGGVTAPSTAVSAGNVSLQTKSAASRLGVTPSLSGVRAASNQGPAHSAGTAQNAGKAANQPYAQTQYYAGHNASGYCIVGSGGAVVSGGAHSQARPRIPNGRHTSVAPPQSGNPAVSGGIPPNQGRTFSASSAGSSVSGQNPSRNHIAPAGARTFSGTSDTAPPSSVKTNGTHHVTNAVNGGNLISDVENFNKSAAPEQKLKYTREIIL